MAFLITYVGYDPNGQANIDEYFYVVASMYDQTYAYRDVPLSVCEEGRLGGS